MPFVAYGPDAKAKILGIYVRKRESYAQFPIMMNQICETGVKMFHTI